MQQNKPEDCVIATGAFHTLREFLDAAFMEIGISNWEPYVGQDPRFMRPADVFYLAGNATKANEILG